MLFKILRPTYINESLKEVGETVDYPVEKMAKNPDGSVNMTKHSSLEPLEPFPELARPAPAPLTPGSGGKGVSKADADAEFAKALAGAINGLDHANNDHWTEGGKPNLKALEQTLGFKVSREQVDTIAPNARRELPAA